MFFVNKSQSPRTFMLLREWVGTNNATPRAETVHVLPGQEVDFTAEDLRQISKGRASSAIFEADFAPGRAPVAASRQMGAAARGPVQISDKMRALIERAEVSDQVDRREREERNELDREERTWAIDAEEDRRERERASERDPRRVDMGGRGIELPPGSRLSAAEAADVAGKAEAASRRVAGGQALATTTIIEAAGQSEPQDNTAREGSRPATEPARTILNPASVPVAGKPGKPDETPPGGGRGSRR